MNVVVPTGNFGNLQAAYYAKRMGLPIDRIISASNKNNVLVDFFATGVYQSQRDFFQTISPSMDILISSNFERFLYEMSGRDAQKIRAWYDSRNQGTFTVDPGTLKLCQDTVFAGWSNEEETLATISQSYQTYKYVFDPHTAVAMKVYKDYLAATNDSTFTVIASTASPFKFSPNVLMALEGEKGESLRDEWAALNDLSKLTGWSIPSGLKGLDEKPAKTVEVCEPEEIAEVIQRMFI